MKIQLVLVGIIFALPLSPTKTISKIAFGSCYGQFNNSNPRIFTSINTWQPDLFLWLGDVVYADEMYLPFMHTTMKFSDWQQTYNNLKTLPSYAELSNSTMVTGIWDDHDYGLNAGNKTFIHKEISKQFFLEFLNETRDHEGIYHSVMFGESGKRIKLILLDNRWFSDDKDNPDGDTFGEEQWEWLGKELKNPGEITLILVGIQVNVEYRYLLAEMIHEKSRIRLLNLIKDIPGVILVTGDIHYGELLLNKCWKYPIYEITASGLSHTELTTYGPVIIPYFSIYVQMPYNVYPRVHEKHFSTFEIDWETGLIEITHKNTLGDLIHSHTFYLKDLYTETSINYICNQSLSDRHYAQFLTGLIIFILPILINLISFIIFLRKFSHCY
ncbi:unnamed protein product [Blepharisma stoltei]|uniref:PhoD-like phosphatase metallophosphatase domain-containing protein n=1 Tax=Blepharisma stoltei TaxID=1481888 RepID=A0AAU9KAW4_9CILI|nr:unnamed protein product [Blepharisma stoltei]